MGKTDYYEHVNHLIICRQQIQEYNFKSDILNHYGETMALVSVKRFALTQLLLLFYCLRG